MSYPLKKEYSGSTANPNACYSKGLTDYGAHGLVNMIVPPTPVSLQPYLFNQMRPHKIPITKHKPNHNCSGGYRTLCGLCR